MSAHAQHGHPRARAGYQRPDRATAGTERRTLVMGQGQGALGERRWLEGGSAGGAPGALNPRSAEFVGQCGPPSCRYAAVPRLDEEVVVVTTAPESALSSDDV